MTERTYRIGEAARLLDLEGYVLRYWETEFAQLRPGRTPKGQRVYSEADLALLRRIRELLHEVPCRHATLTADDLSYFSSDLVCCHTLLS